MIAYTVAFRRFDLLLWQQRCIAKFCAGLKQLIVVNNGPDETDFTAIHAECERLGLQCLRGPGFNAAAGNPPSCSHAAGLDAAWQHAVNNGNDALFLDSDCFPIENTPATAVTFDGCEVAALFRPGVGSLSYLYFPCPILAAFRHQSIEGSLSWAPMGQARGYADTGAQIGLRLMENGTSVKRLSMRRIPLTGNPPWEIIDEHWLHVSNGTNWMNWSPMIVVERDRQLLEVLERSFDA